MFNLFVGEIEKSVKKRTVIGISVALTVLLILIAIVFNLIVDLMKEAQNVLPDDFMSEITEVSPEEYQSDFYTTGYLSEQELNDMITVVKQNLTIIEEEYKKDKRTYYSDYYSEKSKLVVLEYAKDNGYYNKKVFIYGMNESDTNKMAENFVGMYSAIIATVLVIYGIILGAGMYVNEYKSGTIKLVMVRPITKNRLTTAKLCSVYAILTAFFLVFVLVSFVYGAIAFGSNASQKVLYSFNATSAGVGTVGGFTFASIMIQLFQILILSTISFSLATITRKSTIGIISSLVILLGIGNFLSGLGINAFLLSDAMNLMNYFGVGNEVAPYGNFFVSLAVTVFWTAVSIVGVYVVTNKKDVI